ncbi:MAG: DegV family protein [Clostridia bacterium]|jgi:DegV family protein with EDD domain|nr:DegV family protein [Clostridia bacterium]
MSYYITTDATCDLIKDYYDENFGVIPMDFTIKGETFNTESRPMDYKEFYDLVRQGEMPTTAQVTAYTATEFLTPILEKGYDVYHIAFSSALSGTYDSAIIAQKELQEKFPDRKIYVIDSLNASMGEGLLVYHALQKRKEGASIEELDEYLKDLVGRLCSYFTVDDLKHLVRTGRISKIAGSVGSALKLKPVLYVNDNGRLINIDKVMGRKKAILGVFNHMQEKFVPCKENEVIAISDGDAPDVDELIARIKEAYPSIKTIIRTPIGPVIGSHSGPQTIAVFFVGKDKLEKKDPEVNGRIAE